MDSCKYIPFLIVFIIPSCLDLLQAAFLQEEEAAAMKFTAKEDTQLFYKAMETVGEGYGTSWIVMPDGNGTGHFAMMQNDRTFLPELKITKSYTFEEAADLVTFNYYKTKREDDLKFKIKDLPNIAFDNSKPIKFICHGWIANSNSSVITGIRDAYLAEQNVNVIGVDWSPISEDLFYPNAAGATEVVGKVLGQVIDSIVRNYNARHSDFHLVGHSLGAHVVGFAGNFTQRKVGRITGLDPALPGFQYVTGSEGRLDRSDAEFVDVIHTCSGVLGMSVPVGHVDFYPNGGSVFQPGCVAFKLLDGPEACSHSRSHQFFAESIYKTADFESVRCQDWEHFKKNQCEKVFTLMGEKIPRDTKPGVYYLKTNWEPPFSQGPEGLNF